MPKMILYGVEISNPCRIVLLTAKILGLNMELKEVDFLNKEHKSETFTKMNPAGTVPTLDDNGFHIWESRAIVMYLMQKYGGNNKMYPKDANARALVDNMLFYDDGAIFPKFAEYFYPQIFYALPADPAKESAMKDKLAILEKTLERNPYVAGQHLTVADLTILVGAIAMADACLYDMSAFPHVKKWMEKCKREIPHFDEVTKAGIDQQTAVLKSGKAIL